MRNRRTALVALGASLALVLAACGSSSKGKSTGGTTPSSSGASTSGGSSAGNNADASAGFTADSITIEGDVDKTSASGQSEALAELGAKARFARANADGGVNGRKINYLGSADNKLDPAQDLPTVKKIVEQDKAFAVVPMVSPVLAAGGTYLVNNKVPFFGWGITPAFCNNLVGFGYTGCLVPTEKTDEVSTASAGLVEKLLGIKDGTGKTVALISEDDVAGQFGIKVIQAAFVADHWKVTYSQSKLPSTSPTTDFSPYSQAILTSNGGKAPDVMFHVTTVPNAEGLTKALTNAGFKGIQMNAVTYDPAFLSGAAGDNLDKEYVFIQYGDFQTPSAANDQMLKDVQSVQPSQKELTQDIAIGYYSADIFLHDLQKAGKNLSRQGFLDVANDKSSYNVPGGIGPISFPDNHQNSVPCGSLVQIDSGKYVSKVPLTCFKNVPLSVLG
ncbi:MAG TPA: ABC transporter substrate-binding protein [Frankiaceae bacterium]|nr:ABC transporter substrate-binding protein [Frankiaceae bacterium]